MVRQKCSGIRRSYLELIGNAKKVTITWHKFSTLKTRARSYMSKRVSAMKNGIYGHSRFCNTDFDDKLACLNLSGV